MDRRIAVGLATIALGCAVSTTARAQSQAQDLPPPVPNVDTQPAQPMPPAQTEVQVQTAPQTQTWTTTNTNTVTTETTPSYVHQPFGAPRQAFEIGVAGGYTQGFGSISENRSIGDLAHAGFGIGGTLGYRATPLWSIALDGQFQTFNPNNDLSFGTHVNGMTAGIDVTLHAMPYSKADPYVMLGTGFRMMWEAPDGPNNNIMDSGFQLGKLQLGLDWRAGRNVALGPVVGADLNLFVWRNGPSGNFEIPNKRVNTFLFAGLAGRFDLGGSRDVAVQQVGMLR